MATVETVKIPKLNTNNLEWFLLSGEAYVNVGMNAEVGYTTTGQPPTVFKGESVLQNETITNERGDIYVLSDAYYAYEFLEIDKPSNIASVSSTDLVYATTIAIDLATSNNFNITLTGNASMGLPINIVAGQSGRFYITQDATGGRILDWATAGVFKILAPYTEDTTTNKINVFEYDVYDVDNIVINYLGSF